MARPFRSLPALVPALALASALLATGCGTRGDLTPELHSYTGSIEQDRNTVARVVDNNTRLIWDDIYRVLLLDRTSDLTRWPTP